MPFGFGAQPAITVTSKAMMTTSATNPITQERRAMIRTSH
jgi:hypothetical protein